MKSGNTSKFNFLDYTKCCFSAFCVKQARWVKAEVMCSRITTHSKPREDWYEWWIKVTADLNIFKNYKRNCILSKSDLFCRSLLGDIYNQMRKWKNDFMGTSNSSGNCSVLCEHRRQLKIVIYQSSMYRLLIKFDFQRRKNVTLEKTLKLKCLCHCGN